jgi:PmbA protein
MNKNERLDLAQWAMDLALKNGADQAAVALINRREIEIEFRDRKLEKLRESVQNRLSLDLYVDHRYSGHSTNDLRKDSLARFVEEAIASTKYLTHDEFRSLPDPRHYPKGGDIDLVINDPAYGGIDSDERVRMASEIEAAAMSESDRIISVTAYYSDVHTGIVQVHSNGFVGANEGTRFEAGAEVTVEGADGGRPQDWSWAETRFRADLPAAGDLGREAVERTLQKVGQDKIASGTYDMIIENRVGQRILQTLRGPMSGRNLQQKNSYLEGMLGKKIASEKFTVTDDPLLERGLGSRLFDNDGLAAKRRVMIDEGVLQQYYIGDYYGRKLGMEPTTGSPSNVVFAGGTKSLAELIKGVQRGIFVNGFIGGNANSTTGDFSFGIVGVLIENGDLTKPLNEMNISGNAKDFWNRLVALGNDPDRFDTARTPSMLFDSVEFSGL